MSRFLKHVGKNQYGSKVVIVFRELPDDPEHCLVVETQTLNEMYHDNLMRTLESNAAQDTVDLYEVLSRSHFGDGGQMLNTLHERGLLRKYKIDDINVEPMPNRSAPLRTVNEQIRLGKGDEAMPSHAETLDKVVSDTGVSVDTAPTAAPVTAPEPASEEQQKSLAESKLLQARLMEEDAKTLRDEAYKLDPDLKKGGRPSKKQVKKVAKAKAEANAEE